ncbi:MAG: M15 family metallopeptidase [Alistipes sp.]|nr:M15 family metallopeptidase [Alistipes sp.]
MPKNINQDKSIRRTKTMVELVVCAVFIGTAAYLGKSCYDNAQKVPKLEVKQTLVEDITIPDPSDAVDPDKIIFVSSPVPTKNKFYGDLILVNNDYQYYTSGEEDLVSIMTRNDDTGRSDIFTAVDYTYSILSSVYEPMAEMIQDFYDIYYNNTLIIYGSYRTTDFQEQLYEQFMAATENDGEAPIAAKPGFSEHETGLAFDFSETVSYDYQGTGDFAWINQNSYKYGFIVRYTEEKESITEYREEPWHFRYVGIPHATYMTKNDLCLEEYIDLLRTDHSYDSEHLEITDDQGAAYEVYFYPSDDGAETTNVPVPSGYEYDISGNNVDGFIVTVYK